MKLRLRLALELERLRRKNLKKLHPLQQLFWECTLRCNVHCLHCGSDCVSSVTQPDMPMEDFLKVLDEEITPHVNPRNVLVIISGGEPTMRKDLAEIGRQIKKRGYPWGMVSNGLALTEERFKELRQAGLRSIAISLDGLEEDHTWVRQHPMAFEAACRAIKLCAADKKLTWDVVTCVTRRSINHLDKIRELMVSLGVTHWRIFGIDPMGRAAKNPELILTDDEFKYLIQYIADQREKAIEDEANGRTPLHVTYSCEGFLGDYEGRVRNYLYQCAAGISVASILIDGNISACTSIRGKYYQGNIYRDRFWNVWEKGFKQYRDRSWMKKIEPCNDCAFFRYCEGNGMHLRREDGSLMLCHLHRLQPTDRKPQEYPRHGNDE